MKKTISICGAGIIGSATAYLAQKDGYQVTLIEKDEPASGSSFGNAAMISKCSVHTYANPTAVKSAIPFLLNESPLGINLNLGLRLIPHGINFLISSLFNYKENMKKLNFITSKSHQGYKRILNNKNISKYIKKSGFVVIYFNDDQKQKAIKEMKDRKEFGIESKIISRDELFKMNPETSLEAKGGIYYKDSYNVRNPYHFVNAIVKEFKKMGGKYMKAGVEDISSNNKGGKVKLTNGKTIDSDFVVMALGFKNYEMAKKIGRRLPILPERGYHFMSNHNTKNTVTMKCVMTGTHLIPMLDGIRIVNGADFAQEGSNYPKRILNFIKNTSKDMSKINLSYKKLWVGHRPSTPDYLPLFEIMDKNKKIFMAGGHGHFGMTMGGFSAEATVSAIKNGKYDKSLQQYTVKRFWLF